MKTANISVDYIDHMGSDNSVVSAARVSFDKAAENYTPEQNAKLIKYLAKHKHFSPFNHSFITLRINAPIFVSRQLVKHKFMPINVVSRRYVQSEPEFYFPGVWRMDSESAKQGSSDEPVEVNPLFMTANTVKAALEEYNRLLSLGVCPEQARMILPQNMMTSWYWSGTLGAYCDMLRLRLDPHTQKESREVAQKVREIIEPLFPVSVPALLATE